MANNIEWAHANLGAALVDPEDVQRSYEGFGPGEIGVWLGSDAAVILYGTPEQVIACAERIRELAYGVDPRVTTPGYRAFDNANIGDPDDQWRACWSCHGGEAVGYDDQGHTRCIPCAKKDGLPHLYNEERVISHDLSVDSGLEADLALIRKTNDDAEILGYTP